MFVTIPTFVAAALVDFHRRRATETLTFWWLLPQYFMLGLAESFTLVGQLEFFYDEATDGTKSISSALFLSAAGVGSWMSSLLVKVVVRATGGKERGWLRRDLNQSKLDYYYWVVCVICAMNFGIYLVVASYYKGKGQFVAPSPTGKDESRGKKGSIAHVEGSDNGTKGEAKEGYFTSRIEGMEVEKKAGKGADELPVRSTATLVGDGAVDFYWRIADKVITGGWRAAPFIIDAYLGRFLAIVVFSCFYITKCFGAAFFLRFTGNPRGLSSLQRIGVGMFVTIPIFVAAALVELHRSRAAEALTFWWLLPQYFMLGLAEAFTFVGQLEFF
ncbi:hypothetical protein HPP92_012573 [Vanilla planifolia]|uniref:Uncharacterized protein n=1 Tax=Vanilla planifolia TaxID=51239 RepID=A0A835QX46_VANPL|nr:hypothetical protein HPP92_012573 [Vanilla planifolia]